MATYVRLLGDSSDVACQSGAAQSGRKRNAGGAPAGLRAADAGGLALLRFDHGGPCLSISRGRTDTAVRSNGAGPPKDARMKVVIVELPAKAKTINKYLGKDYEVYASFGHVRDLKAKDGSVDPDNDFAMRWEVDAKAAKRLSEIGGAVKDADRVILATDPDREGEAISWHIHEILKNKKLLRTSGSTGSCSTPSPRTRCRRRCAIRARSTRRWSTPIGRAARSTISSASPCPRCCGASCRARARPGACSRWRCASSATASSRSRSSWRANIGRSSRI